MDHQERAALWRTAATELRRRPPGGPHDPGPYAVLGIARLLDALADTLHSGDRLRHDVVTATDELARHIHRYVPGHDPDSETEADHPS